MDLKHFFTNPIRHSVTHAPVCTNTSTNSGSRRARPSKWSAGCLSLLVRVGGLQMNGRRRIEDHKQELRESHFYQPSLVDSSCNWAEDGKGGTI